MRSLQYLNSVSTQQITFTDNRDANVIFDRFPKDYNYVFTEASFSLQVGTEIVEIIDPTVANIRYQINIAGDVTLDFGTLPQGISVTNLGTVYTVYGIDSVSDWDAVKSPTVTLGDDFFGDVSYTVTFIYDTPQQTNITVSFDVNTFIPQTLMDSQATLDVTASAIRNGQSQFVGIFTFFVEGQLILLVEFTLPDVEFNRIRDAGSDLSTAFTQTSIGTRIFLDFTTTDSESTGSQSAVAKVGAAENWLAIAQGATEVDLFHGDDLTTVEHTFDLPGNSTVTSVQVEVLGDYRFVSASYTKTEQVGLDTYTTYDTKVYRDYQESNTWTSVLTLTGTNTTRGFIYHKLTNINGNLYLAVQVNEYDSLNQGDGSAVRVYKGTSNGSTWTQLYSKTTSASSSINLDFAFSNSYFILGDFQDTCKVYNLGLGTLDHTVDLGSGWSQPALDAKSDLLAISSNTNDETKLWNLNSESVERTFSYGAGGPSFQNSLTMTDAYIAINTGSQTEVFRTTGTAMASLTQINEAIALTNYFLAASDTDGTTYTVR